MCLCLGPFVGWGHERIKTAAIKRLSAIQCLGFRCTHLSCKSTGNPPHAAVFNEYELWSAYICAFQPPFEASHPASEHALAGCNIGVRVQVCKQK